MAKKKRAAARKKSAARRKPAPRRTAMARRSSPTRGEGKLRLKDLRRQIETARGSLEKARAGDPARYRETEARFARMLSDIDWLCAPENSDGCGPHMVFPLPG